MRRRNLTILSLFLLAVAAVMLRRLHWLTANGGGPFLQGDWLINSAAGPVRRGWFGDGILALSDIIGLGPLQVLGIVQAVALIGFLAALWHGVRMAGLPDRLILLVVSPLAVAIWVYDPEAGFRKELLGYLAFAPLFARAAPRAAVAAVLGLFAVAVAAHEANVFLAPALMVALRLRFAPAIPVVPVAGVIVLAAAAIAFALTHARVDDTSLVCAALTGRGLGPEICAGAIAWLALGLPSAAESRAHLIGSYGQAWPLLVFVLALVPALLAIWGAPRRHEAVLLGLALLAAIAPLYLLGVDWGRWMSMQMISLLLVLTVLAIHHRPAWLLHPVRPALFYPLFLASGLVGVHHYGAIPVPGLWLMLADIAARKGFGAGFLP